MMKHIDFITIFPDMLDLYVKTSILKRAQEKKLLSVRFIDLRNFAKDARGTVDDPPYGGGPGMVLRADAVFKAVLFTKRKRIKKTRVVLLSTRGKLFSQRNARKLASYDHIIFICGRYEGVDERVARYIADEEISIGEYILSGGELPALVVLDSMSRHIPGVLGRKESLEEIKGSYPVYTRPPELVIKNGKKKILAKVPEDLISGNHKKIEEWRRKYSRPVL